ncbi:hypothetical protein, partial [Bacillus sp. JJ1474]|uniref:hypothetical protein n=1 Tax=Bacillus sp. JJ1474 TaxID=3122955 RepID=UPI002FFF2EE3
QFIFSQYLPRNVLVLWVIFLLSFLYSEKHIKKKTLITVSIFFLLAGIPFLNILSYLRVGEEIDLSVMNYATLLKDIIVEETFYPIMYQHALDSQSKVSAALFFLWVLFLPIPTG